MTQSFIRRFIFDKLPIRGAYVDLSDVWGVISGQQLYPGSVEQILGEILAANILIANNLKFNGKVITQIQNNPKLKLVVSECTHDLNVRATAKFSESLHKENKISYLECLEKGQFVVSVDSKTSGQIYQSIIELSQHKISDLLNEYMSKSEQLNTFFVIAYTKYRVVGLMLQELPNDLDPNDDEVNRIFTLASTLTSNELIETELVTLLKKVFYEDDIALLESLNITFNCTCSRESVSNMIKNLGEDESESIIKEQGSIQVTCDFCNTTYAYTSEDVNTIFESSRIYMESNVSKEVH